MKNLTIVALLLNLMAFMSVPNLDNFAEAQGDFERVSRFGREAVNYGRILLSPDETKIAVEAGTEIEIWDLDTETMSLTIPFDGGHYAWSPDSSQIATSKFNTSLQTWDVSSGALLSTRQGVELGIMAQETTRWMEWHNRDAILTAGGALLLWKVNSDELPETQDCHLLSDTAFRWSPDKSFIAVFAWESTQVWICNDEFKRMLSFEGYTTLSWSPNNNELAAVGIGNTLRIWNVSTGEVVVTTAGDSYDTIRTIAWSPDWAHIATGHLNGELHLWQRMTNNYLMPISSMQIDGLSDIAWLGEEIITTSVSCQNRWDIEVG